MKIMKFPGDLPAIYTFLLQVIGCLPLRLSQVPKDKIKERKQSTLLLAFGFL
jgi:hypothetical protein